VIRKDSVKYINVSVVTLDCYLAVGKGQIDNFNPVWSVSVSLLLIVEDQYIEL